MTQPAETLPIWGSRIPFNTGESKLPALALKKKAWFPPVHLFRFIKVIGKDFIDDPDPINWMTSQNEIRRGGAKQTFDDVPHLIPFVVDGSDRALIVVPGGGYVNKSMAGEGTEIAQALNQAGISAFVLWYRVNPYRAPAPFLDLQRAVRYVKYHAGEYGIDPTKVGVIGFSAGGHNCAMLINLLRNSPVAAPGYVPDDVDSVDDRVALAGLVYPAIDLAYNPGVLFALSGAAEVHDAANRQALIERYNPTPAVRPGDPPQFLCYGTKDLLVDPRGVLAYQAELAQQGVPNQMCVVKGAGHGFGSCDGSLVMKMINGRYVYWIKAFTDWANGVFDSPHPRV
jgi:acetyl esterase/lipase